MTDEKVRAVREGILVWYAENRRTLPWRGHSDPYAILVAEIMLQQTGVDRVRPIFERFLTQFPSFEALAAAPRVEVLRAWAGLGYNRRAVRLQECAQIVVRDYQGTLPTDASRLRRLPGFGQYTVNALRSFAFHQDVTAIDTNVRRVIGRIFLGDASHQLDQEFADRLIPPGHGADWNQALMDFGSGQCVAIKPRCLICPLARDCLAVATGEIRGPFRRLAENPERYDGSRRYFRGRIVAQLRELAIGETVTLPNLLAAIKPAANPDALPWIEELCRALAAEGLARLIEDGDTIRIGPPA